MRNFFRTILVSFLMAAVVLPLGAAERSTPEQAMAMVKSAVAYVGANGREKAFAAFNDPNGQFVKGDLYVMVYDMEGNNRAHGNNPKLIGKNLLEIKDANNVYIVKKFIEVAKTKGRGWVDYKWPNAVTKAVEDKSTYVEVVGDVLIGVGVYKQ